MLGHRARRRQAGRRRRDRRHVADRGRQRPRPARRPCAASCNRRTVEAWMRAGVTVVDPATTWIDVDVDARAGRRASLPEHPAARRDRGRAGTPRSAPTPRCVDTVVGQAPASRTHGVRRGHRPGATVGPFTYLRPGTGLGRSAKIGAFVEIKNATVGRRLQGAAPVLRRRRRDRRGHQHRRRPPSSSTTTASRSTAPSSATTSGSAATRCWWRRSRSATAPTPRPAR